MEIQEGSGDLPKPFWNGNSKGMGGKNKKKCNQVHMYTIP